MSDLDDRDRKLLTLLADDATPSYAELGKQLNLSAPAVHERVKRLKRDGLIKGIAAKLDGRCWLLCMWTRSTGRSPSRCWGWPN